MEFESQPSIPEEALSKNETYQPIREELSAIFRESENPNERIIKIMREIGPLFKYLDREIFPDEKIKEMQDAFQSLATIPDQDKEHFLDRVIEILKPALEVKKFHPDKFEAAQAMADNERSDFTPINRLISYGKYKNTIHIHHSIGETVGNKKSLYLDAMRKLAIIVNNDPKIQEITATSWIVAKNPGIFTRFGFKIEDISDEIKQEHTGEEREIKKAKIDRKEFLKKFLEQK